MKSVLNVTLLPPPTKHLANIVDIVILYIAYLRALENVIFINHTFKGYQQQL